MVVSVLKKCTACWGESLALLSPLELYVYRWLVGVGRVSWCGLGDPSLPGEITCSAEAFHLANMSELKNEIQAFIFHPTARFHQPDSVQQVSCSLSREGANWGWKEESTGEQLEVLPLFIIPLESAAHERPGAECGGQGKVRVRSLDLCCFLSHCFALWLSGSCCVIAPGLFSPSY